MRTRLSALTLTSLLLFMCLACSKPAENNNATDSSQPANQNPTTTSSPSSSTASNMAPSKSEASKSPQPVVVPAGTVITVRLAQALGSKISNAGDSFSATVAQPVSVDGKEVIPSGASASGTVVSAKPLGRFKGAAELQIRLTSVTAGGVSRPIETSSLVRTQSGKGKRTAVMIGGGGGVGALIGGLAGGGKGAAIGALAGAGAGTAGSAFTGNKDVVLPAESAVSFKLEQPLEIKP